MHKDLLANISLTPDKSISHAIRCIDASGGEIALVVDENRRLLGSITDGDIRRAILRGLDLQSPSSEIMNTQPRVMARGSTPAEVTDLMRAAEITQVPIVDERGIVVDIVFERDFKRLRPLEHDVIIMAGGIGSRLRPLTATVFSWSPEGRTSGHWRSWH